MQGTIVDIQASGNGGRGIGCAQFITLELQDGNIANFIVSAETYVINFRSLQVGMDAMFFYEADIAVPLIYPPQFKAVVAGETIKGQSVKVSYFNQNLISSDRSLQLNLDENVPTRTVNNQNFTGNPANRYLAVIYDRVTRSIPGQTTPLQVVVLCNV